MNDKNRRLNRSSDHFRHVRLSAALVTLLAVASPTYAASAAPAAAAATRTAVAPDATPAPSTNLLVDRVAAIVNQDVITQAEFERQLQNTIGHLHQQGTPLPDQKLLANQVMEHLIMEKLQLQRAEEHGIRVDATQVDTAMERMASNNHLTLASFRTAISQQGMDYAVLTSEVRNQLIIQKLRDHEVMSKIHVSDREVDNFLKSQNGQQNAQREYDIQHILVRLPTSATADQVRAQQARAQAALAALRAGKPFAQVAASYSDDNDALKGGDLGWRPAAQLPDLFLQSLNTMKPGDVSDVMRSPSGFHIIRLVNARESATQHAMVVQTHARHILVRTSPTVSDQEAREKLARLRTRAEGGDFAQLAKLNSDDGSASQGGDLGWLSPGETVPEFERAMNALQPGQISQPIKSQFGWHLIQVLGRREQQANDETLRARAREEIGMRKAEESYQEWLRELRDEAYVVNNVNQL